MQVISYLHFFCSCIYLFLAFYVLIKNPRALINKTCSAILFCFGLWSLSETIVQNPFVSKKTAILVENIGALGWIGFSSFFFWFALIFSGKKRLSRSFYFIGSLFILPVILLYQQWTDGLTVNHTLYAYGWTGQWADSVWTYVFYAYYFTFATIGLYFIYDFGKKTAVEFKKHQANILIISAIIPLVLGTVSNVILRQLDMNDIPPLGDVFILTWAIGMGYVISRYKFLGITPTIAADKIISDMTDLMILLDTQGTIVSVNKSTSDLLGYDNEELENSPVEVLFRKGDVEGKTIAKIKKGQKVKIFAVNFKTKKGIEIPISLTTSIIPGSGTVCIARDITLEKETQELLELDRGRLEVKVEERTKELSVANEDLIQEIMERKKTEEDLRESEEKLKILFEYAPDAYFINDFSGTFIDGNKKAEEIIGYKKDELIGKSFLKLKLLTATQLPKAAKSLAKNALGLKQAPEEFTINRKDGSRVQVEIVSYPIKIKNKKVVLGIARDITQRKQIEDEKVKLEEQLFQSQKMEAIGQLAGGIAHDFNNMLGAISGYAEMIKKKFAKDNPKLEKYITRILEAALRSADLTAKLLTFARKGPHQISIVNIHETIEGVINLLEHTIDKRIKIATHFNAHPPTVEGDSTQLQNAVLNIAVNAFDAMPQGGELSFSTDIVELDEGYISTRPYEINAGTYLKLSISDSGIGMHKQTVSRIFEPFFTTKDPGKGTGLGLASVYGAVKNHGGSIEVESNKDKGTIFFIYLPSADKPTLHKQTHLESVKSGKGRILVIDDEELILDMSREILTELGFSVDTCKDGTEALEFYTTHASEIDIVLLDLIMPKLNGYELFMKLKAVNPHIKVIICSGYAINDDSKKIMAAGAMEFIQKPFNIKNLLKLINEVLHSKNA